MAAAHRTLLVVVAPPAAFEIADAAAAYEATRTGLGAAFLAEVRGVRIRIENHPELCPQVHREAGVVLRRALVHRFPYSVIYRVTTHEIQIVAVVPSAIPASGN